MIGAAANRCVGRAAACSLQPGPLALRIPLQISRGNLSRPLQRCCSCSLAAARLSSSSSSSSSPARSGLQQQHWRQRQQPRRQHPLPPLAVKAEPEEIEMDLDDGEWQDPPPLRYEEGGYTPFEYIEFSDILLKHEISVFVAAPVEKAFNCWSDRLNWLYWFDGFIDEMGFHEEDPSLVSMYLWYRWAMTPKLELYCTLKRTQEQRNKYILEEPVEGMPFVSAVLFQAVDAGQEEAAEADSRQQSEPFDGKGTLVTLRVQYLLPKVLAEFAGQVAVYADVDKKLEAAMLSMREFVEQVDPAALEAARQEEIMVFKEGFEEQRAAIAEAEAEAAAAAVAEEEEGGEGEAGEEGAAASASSGGGAGSWEAAGPAGWEQQAASGAAAAQHRPLGPDWAAWDTHDSALLAKGRRGGRKGGGGGIGGSST